LLDGIENRLGSRVPVVARGPKPVAALREPAHPKMGQLVYEAAEKAKAVLYKKRAEFV